MKANRLLFSSPLGQVSNMAAMKSDGFLLPSAQSSLLRPEGGELDSALDRRRWRRRRFRLLVFVVRQV
jgi:hypothetical protein